MYQTPAAKELNYVHVHTGIQNTKTNPVATPNYKYIPGHSAVLLIVGVVLLFVKINGAECRF